MSIMEGINKALVALVSEGVREFTLTLPKSSYLAAFAEAHPDAKRYRPSAKSFVLWMAGPLGWAMDGPRPDEKIPVEQIWLLPAEEQGFRWGIAKVVPAERLS